MNDSFLWLWKREEQQRGCTNSLHSGYLRERFQQVLSVLGRDKGLNNTVGH